MSLFTIVAIAVVAALAGALPGILSAVAGKRLTDEQRRFLPILGVVVALALVLPGALALRHRADAWVPFTSDAGAFHASFPKIPEPRSQTSQVAGKELSIQEVVATSTEPPLRCTVAWVDYGLEFDLSKPDDVLAHARDGAVQADKGELRDEQPIAYAGSPGRAFTIAREKGPVYARIYLVRRRLYVLTVETPPGIPAPPEVGLFFDSFGIDR